MRSLKARNPASLEVCSLLTKPDRRRVDLPIRYVGFEIPNRFVIGYGLDYAQRYRNLDYVAVLADTDQPEPRPQTGLRHPGTLNPTFAGLSNPFDHAQDPPASRHRRQAGGAAFRAGDLR